MVLSEASVPNRPQRGMALSELLQSSRDDSVPSQSTSASATGKLSSSSTYTSSTVPGKATLRPSGIDVSGAVNDNEYAPNNPLCLGDRPSRLPRTLQ